LAEGTSAEVRPAQARAWLALPALAAALVLLPGLGERDLWAPDEPRFAQVAEELRSGAHGAPGLVLLHLNGEPYGQKPPLYYWMAALLGSPGSRVSELAARLPSALAGVACVALTALLGRALFARAGPATAVWAGFLLLSVYRFGHLARRAQLDVLLTAFEAVAMLAFWQLDHARVRARPAVAVLHAALGLAVLTKGPVGLLPLAVMAVFLAWEGRRADFRRLAPAWALVLSLGPGLAWLAAAVSLAPPGFFGEAVVENLLGRFFAGTSHARPVYYYLYQLPLDFLPWTLLAPLAAREGRRVWSRGDAEERRSWRLLLAWAGTFFVFFTLSAGKRGLYLLPAFPALALLAARGLEGALERRRDWPRWLVRGLAAAAALLGLAGVTVAVRGQLELAAAPGFALPGRFGLALAAAMAAALGAGALARRSGAPGRVRTAAALFGVLALETCVFRLAYPAFDPEKSPRPLGRAAAREVAPGEPVGLFQDRPGLAGLRYYAGRPVRALDDAEDARRYVADGGAAIVIEAKDLDELGVPFEVRARARSGRRETLVVVPAPGTGSGAPERAAPP